MAHHPEKFLDGRMLWRGRIYSPLPFVRSLWGTRINAGVWGTAAFPSVYRTDVHPFAFLPHSIRWQVISFVLTLAGLGVARDRRSTTGRRTLLLGTGLVGLAVTVAKNIAYALRSDVDSLPGSKLWYRAMVAYLHFIQPLARVRGRIRGVLSPPEVALPPDEPQTSRGPRPSLGRSVARAAADLRQRHRGSLLERDLDVGRSRAVAAHRLAAAIARRAHRSRSTKAGPTIATSASSSAAGRGSTCARWSRSTAAASRCVRVSTHLRPTTLRRRQRARRSASRCWSARSPGVALRWPLAGAIAAGAHDRC